MKRYDTYYYVDENKEAPVRQYIQALTKPERAKVSAYIDYVSDYGYRATRPRADYLGDRTGFYELRPVPSRVIYCFQRENKIILLHGFKKLSKEITERDMQIALDRKENCDTLIKFNKAEFE